MINGSKQDEPQERPAEQEQTAHINPDSEKKKGKNLGKSKGKEKKKKSEDFRCVRLSPFPALSAD